MVGSLHKGYNTQGQTSHTFQQRAEDKLKM